MLQMEQARRQEVVKVPINHLAVHARTKKELYRILTVEGKHSTPLLNLKTAQIYLPPEEDTRMHFMQQLLSGEKDCIENGEVKRIDLPRYRELKYDILYKEAMNSLAKRYIPDDGDKRRFDKEWLCNVRVMGSHKLPIRSSTRSTLPSSHSTSRLSLAIAGAKERPRRTTSSRWLPSLLVSSKRAPLSLAVS